MTVLAAPTFLNLRADAWAAIAAWSTFAISLAAAVFVYHQLQEARTLREEQSRPFVIVDVAFRSIVVDLVIRNIGATAATNVVVFFDDQITSSRPNGTTWATTPLFTTGMPLMAPGRVVRFLLDTFPGRGTADLPMRIRGRVSYHSAGPRPRAYTDPFDIDLEVYRESLMSDKGLPELVKEVETLRKEIEKWTDGTRGLHVRATDRDRGMVRELRRGLPRDSVTGGLG